MGYIYIKNGYYNLYMDILKRINELRKERNWTIYRLADESGVSQSTLSNMFSRETLPSISTLEQLCGAFNITLSQFFEENQGQENEFSRKFNMLSNREKNVVLELIDLLNKKWNCYQKNTLELGCTPKVGQKFNNYIAIFWVRYFTGLIFNLSIILSLL